MTSIAREIDTDGSRGFGFHDERVIFRYLKIINIVQARDLGIDIHTIECRVRTDILSKLDKNISLWISEKNVVLDEKNSVETYSYGGTSYNGRTLKGRRYSTTIFFSSFKICKETDDGYVERFSFNKLSESENDRYKDHSNYDLLKSPSMLQIFYGLMKKYDDVISTVHGVIPRLY